MGGTLGPALSNVDYAHLCKAFRPDRVCVYPPRGHGGDPAAGAGAEQPGTAQSIQRFSLYKTQLHNITVLGPQEVAVEKLLPALSNLDYVHLCLARCPNVIVSIHRRPRWGSCHWGRG